MTADDRDVRIRSATEDDVPTIAGLVRELAEYETLADQCRVDVDRLRTHLFGPQPYAEALVADTGEGTVGFVLFHHNYSTFLSRPGLHVEDLYVRPHCRRQGVGRALLSRVIEVARERDCGRVEWYVLHWNEAAKAFYRRDFGAECVDAWRVYRLDPMDGAHREWRPGV